MQTRTTCPLPRLLCTLAMALCAWSAQAQSVQAEAAVPLADAPARPGVGAVLRGWRHQVAERLHLRAAPEPLAALAQMTHLRMKLDGDAELALRFVGRVQLTLRSTF